MGPYLFVDAAYVRYLVNEHLVPVYSSPFSINWEMLKEVTKGATNRGNVFKTFFYDCIDEDKRQNESPAEHDERLELMRQEIEAIKDIEGCHVRLGDVTGKKIKKKRQKRVDVQLAVDMLTHAFHKNYDSAMLIAGDLDFAPAVEEVVRLGRHVIVGSHPRSCARGLRDAADQFWPLKPFTLVKFASPQEQVVEIKVPSLDLRSSSASIQTINEITYDFIRPTNNPNWIFAKEQKQTGSVVDVVGHPDLETLKRFLTAFRKKPMEK